MGSVQTYGGCPNIQGDIQINRGHPNIWEASKHMGVQTYRGIQTYEECPNIWGHQNIQKASKHMGVSKHIRVAKHMGSVQTYESIQTYRWPSKQMGVSKHTGGIPACLSIPQSGFHH